MGHMRRTTWRATRRSQAADTTSARTKEKAGLRRLLLRETQRDYSDSTHFRTLLTSSADAFTSG
jgi:hypothetical protein